MYGSAKSSDSRNDIINAKEAPDLEEYHAVITNISMPGLSGREVLKHIQEHYPATPVIVISGRPDGSDGESLIDMGAFAYITKPFQLDDIEDTVTRAIARHHELTTPPRPTAQTAPVE